MWGHSKKRLVELVTEKQKVHQAHATSAENWQEETEHHLIYMLGSFYCQSYFSPIDNRIK